MWPGDALPQRGITNWSVFTGSKRSNALFTAWMKPPGCKWIYILGVGAGGGGGRPANGNITVAGGGGGSGSITSMLFPAQIFPDIIYVVAGQGGAGAGSAGSNGIAGGASYILIAPNTTAENIVATFNAGGGGNGTTTGGTAGGAVSGLSGIWINASIFTSFAGQVGGNGASAANNNGSARNFSNASLFVGGGCGGGNGTGSGGNAGGSGIMPQIAGGAGTTGDNGANGFGFNVVSPIGLKSVPLVFSGGAGGGGVTTAAIAGRGGNGGYGSGGGGGGGGTNAGSTSGDGGDGGNALIMIGAF